MKKQLVTALAVTGILALGSCQQDPLMEELEQGTELNQITDPPDDREKDDDEYDPPKPPETGG